MSERAKTHNLIGIPIGDWSDDGHGKYENFHLLIPVQFTQEILSENYLKNKELFGFGLTDFVSSYEDWSLDMDKYEVLQSNGFEFSEDSGVDQSSDGDRDFDYSEFEVTINPKAMLEIVVFFIGHGLEGFTARVKEPDFYMFGKWQGPEDGIGYGHFS